MLNQNNAPRKKQPNILRCFFLSTVGLLLIIFACIGAVLYLYNAHPKYFFKPVLTSLEEVEEFTAVNIPENAYDIEFSSSKTFQDMSMWISFKSSPKVAREFAKSICPNPLQPNFTPFTLVTYNNSLENLSDKDFHGTQCSRKGFNTIVLVEISDPEVYKVRVDFFG